MLKMRMQIMEQGGVISNKVACFMNLVIDLMKERFPEWSQEKEEMFTTHLAMATERISKGDIVETMDETAWEDVKGCGGFPEAESFLQNDGNFPCGFPGKRKAFYIAAHLQYVGALIPIF